jgi:hypothetical protein
MAADQQKEEECNIYGGLTPPFKFSNVYSTLVWFIRIFLLIIDFIKYGYFKRKLADPIYTGKHCS